MIRYITTLLRGLSARRLGGLTGALTLMCLCQSAKAQYDLVVSQYAHNHFVVNPAFAGSREGLSLFGNFRKQWGGIEGTPHSVLVSANAPWRNEKITFGASVFAHGVHQTSTAGLSVAAGYRTKVSDEVWLGLALQPGLLFRSTDWSKVNVMDDQDVVFSEKESGVAPILGFGGALYGHKFFAGVSVRSLVVSDDFTRRGGEFAPAAATFLLSGGYLFNLSDEMSLQPSVFADYNKDDGAAVAVTLAGIYAQRYWLDLAFRTNSDASVGFAFMPNKQFKVAYTYTTSLGDLKGYNSGSHEISLHYDLVYRVKLVGPKFF